MATYRVRLKDRKEVAERTIAFYWEKPTGFRFKAGQFGNFSLIDAPENDAEGNTRSFTIASAPHEEDLMVATRMRDTAFKRVLKTMPVGSEVELRGPYGDFTLPSDAARPAVFLTGGIGVTPFRSITLDATRNKLPHRLFLFYSNRRPEDAAFLEELQQIEREYPNYKFIGTMTQMEKSKRSWQGERGYLDKKMLEESISDLTAPIYYVAGPPGMVAAMRKVLNESGVTEDAIRTEEFDGYE